MLRLLSEVEVLGQCVGADLALSAGHIDELQKLQTSSLHPHFKHPKHIAQSEHSAPPLKQPCSYGSTTSHDSLRHVVPWCQSARPLAYALTTRSKFGTPRTALTVLQEAASSSSKAPSCSTSSPRTSAASATQSAYPWSPRSPTRTASAHTSYTRACTAAAATSKSAT